MAFLEGIKDRLLGSTAVAGVLRAAVGSVGVRVAASILGLLVTVMLTRILGKSGLGSYAWVFSTANLMALVAVFGSDRVIVRQAGISAASGNWGAFRGLTRLASIVPFAIALALSGGLVLLTLTWPELFKPARLVPLQALIVLVPLLTIGHVQQATIRGLRWVVSSQIPQQLVRPGLMLLLLGILPFLVRDPDPRGALLWMAGATLVAILVGGLILKRARPAEIERAVPVYKTRAWLLTCLPLMGVAVANKGSGDIASIILGIMSSSDEVADFTVSRQLARFLSFFFLAINFSLGPTIAHMYAEGRMDELKSLGPKTVRFATILVLPVVLAMLIFPGVFLGVYGAEFLGQSSVLRVLVCRELLNIILGSVAIWLMMTGHERLALRGAVMGLVAGIVVNLLLAKGLGALGTSVAMLADLLVTKIVLWQYVKGRLGINPTIFGRA